MTPLAKLVTGTVSGLVWSAVYAWGVVRGWSPVMAVFAGPCIVIAGMGVCDGLRGLRAERADLPRRAVRRAG